jgi:DNA-binding MurR/RpiR family transcriptional regulator
LSNLSGTVRIENLSADKRYFKDYDSAMTQIAQTYTPVDLLTPGEQYIYQYILQYPLEASSMSIRELADKACTSTSSILRLVRKFGFEGYSDFRYELQRNPENGNVFFHDRRDFELNSFFGITAQSERFENALSRAAALISRKSSIFFYGDSYGLCACEAGIRMIQETGRSASYFDPGNTEIPYPTRSCAVVIVGSCTQREMEQMARILPVGRVPIITIRCGGSPVLFPCGMIECSYLKNGGNAVSLIPAVHALEQLGKKIKLPS